MDHQQPSNDARPADVDSIHSSWKANRDTAVKAFFSDVKDGVEEMFSRGATAGSENDSSGALWIGRVTTVAVCTGSDDLAAAAYFTLADMDRVDEEPAAAARLWYERSGDHARRAGNDFAVARAAYWLGLVHTAQGSDDAAQQAFVTAREHAAKAGNPGVEAAALHQLSRLAMSRAEFMTATDYAVESCEISRRAHQYEGAARTFTDLFRFYHEWSFDDLAVGPALALFSIVVGLFSTDPDAARRLGGLTLLAVAPLHASVREQIVRGLREEYGDEFGAAIGQQLDAEVAGLEGGTQR